jgi:predicted MFS family arabinose efflux permease
MMGVHGGLVVGAAVGGVIARLWGVTGPFWFAFVGSALILAAIWRALGNIAHADAELHAAHNEPSGRAPSTPDVESR